MLDLPLLAPDIHAAMLYLETIDGVEPLAERALRPITAELYWPAQRALWQELRASIRSDAFRPR